MTTCLMIGQAPDSHLRDKKKLQEKLYPDRILGRGPKLCGWPKVLCAKQLLKNAGAENACEATSINLEFGFGIGCCSSRRLQLARRAHNNCIASGQQKRCVGHALFVCGDVANISAPSRPHRESAQRNSNCKCCCRDYSAQPREGNNNDNTSMQQQQQHLMQKQ